MKRLEGEATRLQGTIPAAANGIRGFGRAAGGAAGGVRSFGAAVQFAVAPLVAATAAIGGLTAGFRAISEQDFAEARVRTLGTSSEELVAQLEQVSAELNGQASVVELTAAAYDVASAGFIEAADAAKVLQAASLGATGGFSDINTVGNATTSVLNAYGLSAEHAAGLVDKFIQTQNDGKIVVAEYAQNIGKVASAAAGLGIELSEVNAVISQSTAAGNQAEVVFTGLKGALARLASGEASKALEEYGISISAATIEADGLLGTLKKLEGLDVGALFKALGTEAGPALIPVIQNLERFEELIKNQENSAGAAARAQAEAANTIQGAWKQVQTAFENAFTAQSSLSQAIIPVLQGVAAAINAVNTPLGTFVLKLAAVTAGVLAAVNAFVALKAAMAAVAASSLATFLSQQIALITTFGVQTYVAAAAQTALAAASKAAAAAMALTPWGALAAGIGAVAWAFYDAAEAARQFDSALEGTEIAAIDREIKKLNEKIRENAAVADVAATSETRFGGAMGFAAIEAAKYQGQLNQLIARKKELALYESVGVTPDDGFYGPGFAAPPAAPKPPTTPTTPTGGGGGGGDSAADTLRQQMKAGEELSRQFQQQIALLNTKNQLQQQLLNLQFKEEESIRRIQETAAASQQQDLIKNQQLLTQLETYKAIEEYVKGQTSGAKELVASTAQMLADDERRTELIKEGLTPALADAYVNIENQFNAQRKVLDATLLTLETELARVDANSEVAKKIQEQIDKIKELRGELDKGEGQQKDRADGEASNKIQDYMNRLKEELEDTDAMIVSLAQTVESEIGSAMSNAITGLIDGTQTAQEAFSTMFKNIGKAFVDMATQMIAKALVMQALGILTGGTGVQAPSRFATGGFVDGPTNALVGEGGNEYVIPEKKMGSAMARWNAGARGDAVVNGANGTGESGGGSAMGAEPAPQISISGGVMQFNDTNYIRQDQVPAIVSQASRAGEARALRRLQMSPAARRKIGV